MATIKDVAKAAGVSATTVSLIINGKAKERRISEETADRVYNVMNELGYHPNMSARNLRSDEAARPTIAFYWPNDYRSNILSSFLIHFADVRDELGFEGDIVVRSFKNGEMEEAAGPIKKNSYNGIIIGGTSKEDVEYLESIRTRTPIVLINRTSEKYSTVGNDNVELGFLAGRLMKMRGCESAAIFTSERPYMATGLRVQGFLYACSELNINIKADQIYKFENSMTGGAKAAEHFCDSPDHPNVIFCDSDSMAIGALRTFYKRGVRLPQDVRLIAVQFMEDEYSENSIPALTTLRMPNRDVLIHAVRIIMKQISNLKMKPVHELLPADISVRETF